MWSQACELRSEVRCEVCVCELARLCTGTVLRNLQADYMTAIHVT